MAPMAGGVADGEKDGAFEVFGGREGFLVPWLPVDRIGAVLEQIWTGGVRRAESIY